MSEEREFPVLVTFCVGDNLQASILMDALDNMERDLKEVKSTLVLEALRTVKKTMKMEAISSDDEI